MDAWGGEDAHRVLVVIDAGKELSYTALDWTLDHVLQPGDALKLLGVLHQISTSNKAGFQAGLSKLGYKSWTDEKGWNGVNNRTVLDSELLSKKQLLQSNIDLHLRCQKLGITLDIDVQIARDLKCLVVEVAKNFGAHHVVLDRSMKKDKKYYIDNLTCYVTRVKTNDSCQALRPGLHPDMMTISRPISPDLAGHLPQVNVERRPSYRRSSASLFMKEGDSDTLQDEGDVLESEVEEGDQAIPTSRINPNNLRQDLIAVRQWLEDQGSPEPGNMYSREESLQLSASPRSDIVSPSATEDSGCFSRAKETTPMQTETVANSCMSPLSDDSPTGTSSVTHSAELVRPPAINTRAASNTRAWDAEAVDPRNGNSTSRTQPGPISVQPRRVDASWTLQNLNELLNGDVGSYGLSPTQEKKVKEVKAAKAMPVAKLSTSKSTPTLPSAAQFKGRSPVQLQQQQQQQPLPGGDTRNVRRGTFMKKQGPVAPPLCTVCKHKTPEFGKAVRRFSYAELLYATDNFNHHNYLAQGGYGSVYRGILPEGQLIAVKQHKIASNQGDDEFCAEVEVLSCAQHRNLVTLIGYCVENGRRLLVYEYVCNGSLDRHLSAKNRECLPWKYRQKIALGSARALRYLHEECRVGCIVHRDMRPNNILLTHDFTPMVGDFGLARRQMHGDMAEETRVLGTLGYLAPEYAETGQITEKADVYAFGVVLLEIITGRKAVWPSQQGGKNGVLLTDWARELLDRPNLELVDPRLRGTECSDNNLFEMHCMMHAARQCIKKDPGMRPRMAQVLRILDPQQDGEGIYGLGGMGGRKITPDQLPAYNNPAAPPSPVAFEIDPITATNTTSAPSPISSSTSSSKFSKKGIKGPFKNKGMFKNSRSSSAPRLSYDEQRNLEDEEDGFREGVLLSYNTMLEFV
jgi:serine/threonine protein kinase